uniref:Uncharacterized protein n=1 Tax=Heterorhabditis bacteriophora TaxID=37862 RepID=A0A1I7WED4_HETBA
MTYNIYLSKFISKHFICNLSFDEAHFITLMHTYLHIIVFFC